MSRCNAKISSFLALYLFLITFSTISHGSSLDFKFNFSEYDPKSLPAMIELQGNASFDKFIWLTNYTNNSTGRAVYKDPITLWDKATGKVADFTTHFQFVINGTTDQNDHADGLVFFLSSYPSTIPKSSDGGRFGVFNQTNKWTVAVEFDTYKSEEFETDSNHVGIDINSPKSVESIKWPTNMANGSTANAWISYDAMTKNLSVFLTYEDNPNFSGNSTLFYTFDITDFLPEKVSIGFSASTGGSSELHQILYWDFSSSFKGRKSTKWLVIGLVIGAVVMLCFVGLICIWYIRRRKKTDGGRDQEVQEEQDNIEDYDETIDDEFEKGRGPRSFTYSELVAATKNFAEEGKLGEGGFGAVYKGFLKDIGLEVAIKRVSKGSKQGRKEYIAEVKIISQLRHRNLVQLVGWCHQRGDFLLVYELMPNGSLDSHLYTTTGKFLTWSMRYSVALDLASALFYLHEEWESCVVHRDIKPSNVMLDSAFNAKLGDFGLARLVDHGRASQTTVLAGTMGYVAPECVITGKSSKESDVYSFGIVTLELACGRRPVENNEDPRKVRLVECVWDLYGRNAILEAADARVRNGEREVDEEVERLMMVGLWCAHPDCTARPSIKQAISALKSEVALPSLPPKMPVPMFFPPPTDVSLLSCTSISTTCTTNSSNSTNTTSDSAWLLRAANN